MPNSLSACPYTFIQDSLVQLDAFQDLTTFNVSDFTFAQNDLIQLDAFQNIEACISTGVTRHSAWFAIFGFNKQNRIILYEIMRAKKRKKEEYELLTAIAELEGDD